MRTKQSEVEETLELNDEFEKFVLIDAIKSTAQIYWGDNADQKAIRIDTPRKVMLRLKHQFSDKNGRRKITRFKYGANSIFQDLQIKDDSIPANEKFTEEERGAMMVINGVLVTNDAFTKDFLHEDNNPQRADFTGRDRGGQTPVITRLDEVAMSNDENEYIFKTAQAIVKIMGMDKVEASSLLSLFFGSSYPIPERLKDIQNLLSKSLEGSEERIDMVLDGQWNTDDEITILLSKAINAGVISLETKPNYVTIMKDGNWQDSKMIVADTYEQREMLYRQFLASEEGELYRKDIETALGEASISTEKKSKSKKS